MRAALLPIALLLAACNASEEEAEPIAPTAQTSAPDPSQVAAKASADVDAATREAAETPDTP